MSNKIDDNPILWTLWKDYKYLHFSYANIFVYFVSNQYIKLKTHLLITNLFSSCLINFV
jgi:hypothetical protein